MSTPASPTTGRPITPPPLTNFEADVQQALDPINKLTVVEPKSSPKSPNKAPSRGGPENNKFIRTEIRVNMEKLFPEPFTYTPATMSLPPSVPQR